MLCMLTQVVLIIVLKLVKCRATLLVIMKGTKVLTLGAGREVLPHNMKI